MMKNLLSFLSALMLTAILSLPLGAQGKTDTYNYQKAMEILRDNGDESEAMDLLDKQLDKTPDHAGALLARLCLYCKEEAYGNALVDVNRAISVNKPKKTGIKQSRLYWWKAYIYQQIEDFDAAVTWFAKASREVLKDDPENSHTVLFDLAQALYDADRPEDADKVYTIMLENDEADAEAMLGLARNAIDRQEYDRALALTEKALRISPEYSEVYRFMSKAYNGKGEWQKAIDAAIEYFDKSDDPIWNVLRDIALKHENYAVANIKAQLKKSKKPLYWHAFLSDFYEKTFRYADALKEYDWIEKDRGKSAYTFRKKAICLRLMGFHDEAIVMATAAMEEERSAQNLAERGICYRESGRFAEAIEDFSEAIEEEGRFAFLYCSRGWTYRLMGDKEKALEDYNLGIDIDTTYAYIYLERGLTLKMMGRKEAARRDFEHVLAVDTVATDGSCAHYALLELGREKEAAEWMQNIIDKNPKNFWNVYDQACLFTRMNRPNLALDRLERAFELGYRDFSHLEFDMDMDQVRNMLRYKALVEKYKAVLERERARQDLPKTPAETTVSEIAISRHYGGTFEVPCQINSLPLKMIFDTGASDVIISSVEANFMLKNGYLSESDIKGRRYYQTASGQVSAGAVITLKEVRLGDAVLRNVEASVVNSQSAPLLFGQSAMERFGTITIDNEKNKLIIKQ